MQNLEVLKYWIEERYRILVKKLHGDKKPWSEDPIFQNTYFCNVRREDDKVTKFIRNYYSEFVDSPLFETNIVLSRFINWPDTLKKIGFLTEPIWNQLQWKLEGLPGKVWGDAYIVSTNGRAMPKAQYLCEILMTAVYEALGPNSNILHGGTSLSEKHKQLVKIFGLGSFMAAQVIADLKNTPGHPLQKAEDWWTWTACGPGSMRGASWILNGDSSGNGIKAKNFIDIVEKIRIELENMGCTLVKEICNQDLQNCLCEFDKYCRVKSGTGRSKRGYNGA